MDGKSDRCVGACAQTVTGRQFLVGEALDYYRRAGNHRPLWPIDVDLMAQQYREEATLFKPNDCPSIFFSFQAT